MEFLVLFGGGNPSGDFGNSVVQTASEGSINMSNAGDLITMNDPQGNVFLTIDIEPLSNNPNESYTLKSRYLLVTALEQHSTIDCF